MSHFVINGGRVLSGKIQVQGSKNAALPLMAASILNKDITILHNIPQILDVYYMIQILESIGCHIQFFSGTMVIDAREINVKSIPQKWTGKMRSGVMLMGPLLVRCGEVTMGMPGGCSIGKRPVDLHLDALKKLGAEVMQQEEQIVLKCQKLQGCHIHLSYPSVGATENILMAAAGANGVTILENPAKEPEIFQLCDILKKLGTRIQREADGTLKIWGGYKSRKIVVENCGDRIAAATWLSAVAVAGGQLNLVGINPIHLKSVLDVFEELGCEIEREENEIKIVRKEKLYAISQVETGPYPKFPTDVQSILMAVLSGVEGNSKIQENVFEARFQTTWELRKMGADIHVKGNCASIVGNQNLKAACVAAPDLRGGAALIVASLGIKGCSMVQNAEYILRGYENLAEQLCQVGADVSLMEEDSP